MYHSQSPNVAIVLARCTQTKQYYGMRFEERAPGYWSANWAFPLQEAIAKVEGYDRVQVKGNIELDGEYPGCPHCPNMSILQCPCQKVMCWDTLSQSVTCPHCGRTSNVGPCVINAFDKGIGY